MAFKLKKSLATSSLVAMSYRMAIVVFIFSCIGYINLRHDLSEKTLKTLAAYVEERGPRERLLFYQAEKNHENFKKDFLQRMRENQGKDYAKQFNALVEKNADGAIRNRPPFNGKTDVGIFIGKGTKVTPDVQRRVVILHEMVKQYGLPWHSQFQDTYVTTPDNIIVLYWPESPNWVQEAKADFFMPNEEYVWVADKKHDPDRSSNWTGLFYDVVGKIWMTSCETPVDDENGNEIAIIGHDVMVDEILSRTINDHLQGAKNMIIREDGRIIAHPDLMEQIQKKEGNYSLSDLNDENLNHLFKILKENKGEKVISRGVGDEYMASFKIPETGWYFITLYPKYRVDMQATEAAYFIALLGLLSLCIEIGIAFFTLRKKVAMPLNTFVDAVKEVSDGNYQVQIQDKSENEIGELAKTFNTMTKNIVERDRLLARHNNELESLVQERTQELEAQRAKSIHAAKMASLGEMAGGIAHEINNPLASIQLMTEQLKDQFDKDSFDKQRGLGFLLKINNTVERVAKIVHSLRTFSRDGSKDQKIEYSLQRLVDDTLVLCSERIKTNNVKLTIDPIASDIMIECKPTEMAQVLLNLLNNSFDAVTALENKWIHVEYVDQSEEFELRVIDSGHGISEKVAQNLFQPFYTTKDVGKGTGLGLSISRSIVQQHGGDLFLDHEKPNTCFVLRLKKVDLYKGMGYAS